jgi:hypothetical protein
VATPLLRQFDTQIAPRIREGFGNVGAFSSREGDALKGALGDTMSQISSGLGQAQLQNQQMQAQMTQQAYQQAGSNQLNAWNMLSNQGLAYAQQPLQTINAQTQVAGIMQQQKQSELDAKYKDFLRQTQEQSPWLQYALGYTGQNNTQMVNQPGWLDQALGTIGGGIGLLSGGTTLFGGLTGLGGSAMSGLGSLFGG